MRTYTYRHFNILKKCVHPQYDKKDWEFRTEHVIGQHNVQRPALVRRDNILLPPLHIKLGIVKNFMKKSLQ